MSSCSTRWRRCLPRLAPCFACLAVYVQDKIVLILRDQRDGTADNGVWLATTEEHHQSLRREFPNMRSIRMFGKKVTGWQVLPADAKNPTDNFRLVRHPFRKGPSLICYLDTASEKVS